MSAKSLVGTSSLPLHLLVADAHHAVLGHDGHLPAELLIDAIVARLLRARAAYQAGNTAFASREFDPYYVIPTAKEA